MCGQMGVVWIKLKDSTEVKYKLGLFYASFDHTQYLSLVFSMAILLVQ